jgi:DNA-binding protein WhiA
MSFSGDIKREILETYPKRGRQKKAQAYGMFIFARSFSPDDISLHTGSAGIAGRYRHYLESYTPKTAIIDYAEETRRGKLIRAVSLPAERDRRALISRMTEKAGELIQKLDTTEEKAAFLSGAFLSCGNATDPEKSYHLEFAVREQALADILLEMLEGITGGAKITYRRGSSIVYLKDCERIEDMLTLMGASKASLLMVEVEIHKDMRNRVMRRTNCETANIGKTVRASSAHTRDIELIIKTRGIESLPEPLLETARLRLENPELSLRELGGMAEPPVSRSGIFHRLDKLSKIAGEIRKQL